MIFRSEKKTVKLCMNYNGLKYLFLNLEDTT